MPKGRENAFESAGVTCSRSLWAAIRAITSFSLRGERQAGDTEQNHKIVVRDYSFSCRGKNGVNTKDNGDIRNFIDDSNRRRHTKFKYFTRPLERTLPLEGVEGFKTQVAGIVPYPPRKPIWR